MAISIGISREILLVISPGITPNVPASIPPGNHPVAVISPSRMSPEIF